MDDGSDLKNLIYATFEKGDFVAPLHGQLSNFSNFRPLRTLANAEKGYSDMLRPGTSGQCEAQLWIFMGLPGILKDDHAPETALLYLRPRKRNTPIQQFKEMLQNLLSDRFKLAFHRETKDLPSYSLLVAKGGPKMKDSSATQAATDDHPQRPQTSADGFPVLPPAAFSRPGILILRQPDRARLIVTQQTTGEIASYLAGVLGRPVRDATKLIAKYDSTLTFGTEGTTLAYVPLGHVPTPEGEVPPDLLVAVQEQLGLRLEAGKGPVEVIVVDYMEKAPTEN